MRSNLFGAVYVLDEPSAGLHPADTEALLKVLDELKAGGNSLFVIEHELAGLRDIEAWRTRTYLFAAGDEPASAPRSAAIMAQAGRRHA